MPSVSQDSLLSDVERHDDKRAVSLQFWHEFSSRGLYYRDSVATSPSPRLRHAIRAGKRPRSISSSRPAECSRGPIPPMNSGAASCKWRRRSKQALEERRHLIVEAGTGTGKTLAYLFP